MCIGVQPAAPLCCCKHKITPNLTGKLSVSSASQLSRRQLLTAAFCAPQRLHDVLVYTPTSDFFHPPASRIPHLNVDFWSLAVVGAVEHPLILSYADLLAVPALDLPCTVACAADRFNVGHALWRGIPMRTLLDSLTLRSGAQFARLYAADGHTTGITLKQLSRALVAYAINGETLPPEQGFPARLIVPGLYEYKMPRWIERIEIAEQPRYGAWEARGWPLDGSVRPLSAITYPRHLQPVSGIVAFTGFAYAGERAVARVEVRIDGGDWMPVPFTLGSCCTWARWSIDWTPPHPGDYSVQVRATDSDGTIQPFSPTKNINDSHSIHTVIIRVS